MKYRNLLLIDDDEEDIELFLHAVSLIDDTIICKTSLNARASFENLKNDDWIPDLIFLDLHMAPVSGQDFLDMIKADDVLKSIPVIIMSTHSGLPMQQATKDHGAMDYLTKPNSFTGLVSILSTIL